MCETEHSEPEGLSALKRSHVPLNNTVIVEEQRQQFPQPVLSEALRRY
jgi:hypothetical protein